MGRLKLFIPLGIFLILAVFFWRGLSIDPTSLPSALIDKPVPAFKLSTLKDEQHLVDQEEFKGKVSLVNVWATWCVTCRYEHPFLIKLKDKGVPIYGINYKDDVAQAREWLQKFHDPYVLSVVDADGRLGLDLGVYGAPETYVVDTKGVIRYKHVGAVDEMLWEKKLKPLMASLRRD